MSASPGPEQEIVLPTHTRAELDPGEWRMVVALRSGMRASNPVAHGLADWEWQFIVGQRRTIRDHIPPGA